MSFVVKWWWPFTWFIICFIPFLPINSYFNPPEVGFQRKLKILVIEFECFQPGKLIFFVVLSNYIYLRPLNSNTLWMTLELFPGLTIYWNWISSFLNLFLDKLVYFFSVSFLALNILYDFCIYVSLAELILLDWLNFSCFSSITKKSFLRTLFLNLEGDLLSFPAFKSLTASFSSSTVAYN